MTTTAIRRSDTEVEVEGAVCTFDGKEDADEFMRCLAGSSVDTCKERHAPVSVKPVVQPEADDPNRGSVISPSMGGMP